MTHPDDDMDMTMSDEELLAAAAQQLHALVPDRPPVPSRDLALLLEHGLPAHVGPIGRLRAIGGRVAGLGLAAKLMLAAGVAVAGVGGAATAVELSHGSSGHGRDLPRHDPSDLSSPSPDATATPTPAPTPHPTPTLTSTPETHESSPAGDGHHDGGTTSGDGSGSSDGSSASPGSEDGGSASPTSTSGSDGGSSGGSDSGSGSGSGSSPGSDSGSGSGTGSSDGGSGSGSTSGSGDSTSGG